MKKKRDKTIPLKTKIHLLYAIPKVQSIIFKNCPLCVEYFVSLLLFIGFHFIMFMYF